MNLYSLFEATNFRLAKDKQGNAYTPDKFNIALEAISSDRFEKELEKVIKFTANGVEIIPDTDQPQISWFRQKSSLKAHLEGYSLPLDYRHYISLKLGGRKATPVSPDILDKYASSVLTFNPNEKPVCAYYDDLLDPHVQTIPLNTGALLTYYRKPLVPYMDYVVDASRRVYFMPVDSVLTSGGVLNDSLGNLIVSGVSHITATAFPYTSRTEELDWRETFHSSFIDYLVEWGAMNLRDTFAEQVSKKP